MQCKNSKIQNAMSNIFFVMLYPKFLTWIKCLIFSFVFVVVSMYNLILIIAVRICLVDRYEETSVLQNVYA